MTIDSRGGKREKSGRKPVEDKKVAVTVYTPKSRIDKLGLEHTKTLMLNAIEKAFNKTDKN